MATEQFPCAQCGAELRFEPGQAALACPYCGHVNEIEVDLEAEVEEQDYLAMLADREAAHEHVEVLTVHCTNCGADSTLDPNITADVCPFCGSPLVSNAASQRIIKPQAVLPFHITETKAQKAFRSWINGLWFAPNEVKDFARRHERLAGMYIPHWTYDADTTTRYVGRRGEHYYVTERYTTMENGKSVTKTRQVQKTRWYPASGTVYDQFDDVLVVASDSLPRTYMVKLEPWDLHALVPYDDAYLSGFRSESYSVNLEPGFEIAKERMQGTINSSIRRDIGGDVQQIINKRTHYDDITFKHILLPVWISAYRYRDETYRFLVNARTGQVQGERPWSWIKITLAVLAALIVLAAAAYVYQRYGA
ncbi:MAG: hypothetical protein AAGI71_14345 [Bacteroidota bacterium]